LVVVGGVVVFLCAGFLCFLVAVVGFDASAAGVVAGVAAGVPAAGVSAAIAAAARPRVKSAEVIKVPDLFMSSPNGGIDKHVEEYAGSMHFIRDEDHFTNPQADCRISV
jgi:hypothetical protein